MIGLMFAAFFGTGPAQLGAVFADVCSLVRASGHQCRREAAEIGAITIQRDAARHHFYIVLLQTGAGAVFTLRGAFIAGFNTAFVFFMHTFVFLFWAMVTVCLPCPLL